MSVAAERAPARAPRRGWLWIGAEGFCYDVSPSMLEMCACSKSSFLIRGWTNLIHVGDYEVVRMWTDFVQRDKLPPPIRLRWKRKTDDELIWTELRFLRRRDLVQTCGEDFLIVNVQRIRPEAA